MAAWFVTNAIAGAALVPRRQRWLGAGIGGLTAIVASYPGWRARMASISLYGQTVTGTVEGAAILAGAAMIVRGSGTTATV